MQSLAGKDLSGEELSLGPQRGRSEAQKLV